MLTPPPPITIIIPTLCSAQRADSLRRAIASVRLAGPGIATILIAANGPYVDADLAAELQLQRDAQYVYFEEGSAPKTIAATLPLVDSEYFGFLDDDDELLPDSLIQRLAILQHAATSDIVLSNGYLRTSGNDTIYLRHLVDVPANPLETFFVENWLPSCGALFRRSSVSSGYFFDFHPYAEWYWLAFRLAMENKKFCILNEPTFRVNADTPSSLSKSSEYHKSYISLYQKMLALNPPSHIQKILRKRLSQAHHDVSAGFLQHGDVRNATYHHLLSLRILSGLRFLTYTRHIVSTALK